MNAFDGAVTTLGVIMGFFIANVLDAHAVLVTVLATSFALFISGFWSAYLTEKAERTHDLKELEKKLLHSLKNSKMARATRTIALEAAIVDGFSPALISLFIVIPFFFAWASLIPVHSAFLLSIAFALLVLAFLGFFLATVSYQNRLLLALKMLFAGVIAIAFSFLLKLL